MASLFPASLYDIELRVLHGAQAGASLLLDGKSKTIGSDDQCDVILQSPCVAALHATLSVTDDRFTLIPADGAIIAPSDPDATAPWSFGSTIYLGDVAITVDHCSAQWNTVPPPAPPSESATILGKQHTALSTSLMHHWKRWTSLAALLVALAISIQMLFPQHVHSNPTGGLSKAELQAITNLIAQHGYQTRLHLNHSPQASTLRGYLPTTRQVNTLKKDLQKYPHLIATVHAEDALLSASRQYLIEQHSKLKVTINNGQAQLSGIDTKKDDVKRLAQELKQAVPALAGVNATFVEQPQLEGWIRNWRKAASGGHEGAGPLQVQLASSGELELHGTLAPEKLNSLQQALTRHSHQQNMLLAMRTDIAVPAVLNRTAPEIRAFSAGPVPYVFLTDGQRLLVGGGVNGFDLVTVNQHGPVFKQRGA